MSLPAIRAALEGALNGVSGTIATAYENTPFVPATGTPFQQPFLLPAAPANLEIGPGYIEQGIFQVSLYWPKDAGAAAATTQAELIRAAFPFGKTLNISGGGVVNIVGTPEIGPATADGDRFMVPVKIKFQARIGS